MGHQYAELMFSNAVKAVQHEKRSRESYARMAQGEDYNFLLSGNEAAFITARDSMYIASVSETGWPYVQHRGGAVGFIKVLDEKTLGFADYSGNRQYISTGNVRGNDRVSLFFMDYPNQRRLKLAGRVEVIGPKQAELMQQLHDDNYRAKVERGFIIHIEAFDWNCPQHITPRYTESDVERLISERLEAQAVVMQDSSVMSLGDGPLALTISGIRQLTPEVRAYELRSADGDLLPEISAGAHLVVPVGAIDGKPATRHYSICSNPARRDIYEIAVKKQDDGGGGSLAVHANYQLGTRLHCALPKNFFATSIARTQPVVLIAAGIGITPIKPLVQSLLARGCNVDLHYAGRSVTHMAFSDRLQRILGERLHLYPADQGRRINIRALLETLGKNTVIYACGPERLLSEVSAVAASLGLALRLEHFNVGDIGERRPITLRIAGTPTEIEVGTTQTILDAMLSDGIDAPYSCKTGQCKQCVVEVVDGEVEHYDSVLSGAEQKTHICPCVSRAKTEVLTLRL